MSESAFLIKCGWADAVKSPLAGDASGRKYTRLSRPSGSAILMDEGPGSAIQLNRFASIARHLLSLGLSAPEILSDKSDQFLLIEDLGDAVFARVLEQQPDLEETLYKAAIDALIVTQKAPIPKFISAYEADEMADAIDLAFAWYPVPETLYDQDRVDIIGTQFKDLLKTYAASGPVLIQRDFHAENLIWLPDRVGPTRAGLLDFQDAVFGDAAYDMASLLVDARRQVSTGLKVKMIDYYVDQTGVNKTAFTTSFALCSAQRNLRILGVFSRLAIREKKSAYVDLIPRVWSNLQSDLTHPVLSNLQKALNILPEPTEDILAKIRGTNA